MPLVEQDGTGKALLDPRFMMESREVKEGVLGTRNIHAEGRSFSPTRVAEPCPAVAHISREFRSSPSCAGPDSPGLSLIHI